MGIIPKKNGCTMAIHADMLEIIVDTREKKWDHVRREFEINGIPYKMRKLDVGDYAADGNTSVSVDRKQNLSELAKNLMNKGDHARFWKEIRRAHANGIKLTVLCEHGNGVRCLEDVANWRDPFSGVHGRVLMNEIYRAHISWGVTFEFCAKNQTAKRILEILKGC